MARPLIPMPSEFSSTGTEAMPDRWWLALDDPALTALIGEALRSNPGIRATWHRLAQADASLKAKRSVLYPNVDASAGAGVDARTGTDSTRTGSSFSLGLAASYEVDLWGKIGASTDAARLDAQASAQDVLSSAITLTSEIAASWYQLVEERAQQKILAEQVAGAEGTLEIVTVSFERGLVPRSDLLRQQQRVESIHGERDQTIARIAVLEHQLAILLGRPPTDRVAPNVTELPSLPPLPDTGVPGDLVSRRPDVVRAYLQIQSADRRVAVAIADRFPRLSLSARVSTSATSPHKLFSDFVGSLVSNLAAPIFDAGQRKAEVVRAREALLERIELYKQSVLSALSDVEDALVKEAAQYAHLTSLERQLEMTEELLGQAREAYDAGMTDFLRVLDAEETHHSLQRRFLSARREMVTIRLGLYRALAGGWQMENPTQK
jgi:NodT family efflux transporter outer membrane factor (OMF) lipoprotein